LFSNNPTDDRINTFRFFYVPQIQSKRQLEEVLERMSLAAVAEKRLRENAETEFQQSLKNKKLIVAEPEKELQTDLKKLMI
jgi:hypothetical protein